MTTHPVKTLNNGVKIPAVGLGVWQTARGDQTRHAVRWALEAGYRHIDTAASYGNEKSVGEGLRDSPVPREQLFVTTKLWNSDQGYEPALRACETSLGKLGLDYVDLYLIHFPVRNKRLESWRALEKLLSEGKARAIGVSNFTVRHLDELLASAKVVPAVNQVELHPFLYQQELIAHCERHRIALEAYSPLTRGERLGDPTVVAIAQKHGKTAAQILVRWCVEKNLIPLPKSEKKERIIENAQVFDFALTKEELARLDALNENLRTCWDPTNEP